MESTKGETSIRRVKVGGYFLDGYCPALNLEIDEKSHRRTTQKDKDKARQTHIENIMGCAFFRIKVNA